MAIKFILKVRLTLKKLLHNLPNLLMINKQESNTIQKSIKFQNANKLSLIVIPLPILSKIFKDSSKSKKTMKKLTIMVSN